MMRNKPSSLKYRQRNREEESTAVQASVKNRRLAEHMSRRTGGKAVMDQIYKEESVKNRLDRSKVRSSVRDRLGTPGKRGGSIQNRLGHGEFTRGNFGRGGRGRGYNSGRGGQNVFQRGTGRSRAGRSGSYAFRNTQSENGRFQSRENRGRGRGTSRGRGRGRGRGNISKNNLDNDIESYMSNA